MNPDRQTTSAGHSDEQLLRSFLGGEQSSLGELARRHERYLLGLASAMLGGQRQLACDVVQETWMRVIRYGASFNGQSSLKTWLYRVLVNKCRDLSKRVGAPAEENQDVRDESVDAASSETGDERRVLRDAVSNLQTEKREIVLLCYHQALSHSQAAEVLGIPIGTLKSRLHAALTELRATLTAMEIQQ